jgi:hypothetical protein
MGKVKVDVTKSYSGTQTLQKTERVVIQDFTVASSVVLRRDANYVSTSAALAQQVQASF